MAHFIAYASRSVVDQLRSVSLEVCEAHCYYFLLAVFILLHENGPTCDIAGVGGEGKEVDLNKGAIGDQVGFER